MVAAKPRSIPVLLKIKGIPGQTDLSTAEVTMKSWLSQAKLQNQDPRGGSIHLQFWPKSPTGPPKTWINNWIPAGRPICWQRQQQQQSSASSCPLHIGISTPRPSGFTHLPPKVAKWSQNAQRSSFHLCRWHQQNWGFPSGSDGKESAWNAGDIGSVPRLEGSPGEGNDNPFQHSCLENSTDRGAWWAIVQGVANSGTQLSN